SLATLLTTMFLHGSWLHLLSNMWFLWLFGNNVEDSMGHLRFIVFYLLTGLAASGAHVLSSPDSPIPTVGASGAISGVMGAYLVLYPRVRIDTLFIFFFFIRIIPVSAWFVLLLWFALQLVAGMTAPAATGGVAVWAHVGGFVAGAALGKRVEDRPLVRAKRRGAQVSPRGIARRGGGRHGAGAGGGGSGSPVPGGIRGSGRRRRGPRPRRSATFRRRASFPFAAVPFVGAAEVTGLRLGPGAVGGRRDRCSRGQGRRGGPGEGGRRARARPVPGRRAGAPTPAVR